MTQTFPMYSQTPAPPALSRDTTGLHVRDCTLDPFHAATAFPQPTVLSDWLGVLK